MALLRIARRLCSLPAVPSAATSIEQPPDPEERLQKLDLNTFRPLPPVEGSVVEFLPYSRPLRELLRLGVNLYRLSIYHNNVASFILRANFATDIQPILAYLSELLELTDSQVAAILNKNPQVLLDGSEGRMRSMVRFLTESGFEKSHIQTIAHKAPHVLTADAVEIDLHLGKMQEILFLTGSELRDMVVREPWILLMTPDKVRFFESSLHRGLYLSRRQIHALVTAHPQLLMKLERLTRNFIFLHHDHHLEPSVILNAPEVLLASSRKMADRMEFLIHTGWAQFDSTKPLYTSPALFAAATDDEFIASIPGRSVSMETYDAFLRTL